MQFNKVRKSPVDRAADRSRPVAVYILLVSFFIYVKSRLFFYNIFAI